MKATSLISANALFVMAFFAAVGSAGAGVQVPPGTNVMLTTTSVLNPANLHVGDMVSFTVVRDVVVDGQVVIKAGAAAQGEITSAKANNLIGIPGKISVSLRSVTAADGKPIAINASKYVEGEDKMVLSIGLTLICCVLFALIHGGEAIIPAGTEIQATTTMMADVGV